METPVQKAVRVTTNINWFVFGVVFLTVGLFVIYGTAVWAWLGFAAIYVFGLSCAAFWGANAMLKRETSKERES